jgi:hypothetical protein
MPILAKSTGSLLPGRGLINPAFVIKIVPATDDLQQQPSTGRDNPNNDYLDNLKVGTEVAATIGKRKVVGKIQRIIKNELGDGIFAIIADSTGKTYKVEGSRLELTKSGPNDSDYIRSTSSPALLAENRLMSFKDFQGE